MGLSIIIPFRDTPPDIKELRSNTEGAYEIILVNDGGDPKYAEYAGNNKCKYIYNEEPKGEAVCIDMGILASLGEVVCYLPCDSKITTDDWAKEIYIQGLNHTRSIISFGYVKTGNVLKSPTKYFDKFLNLKDCTCQQDAKSVAIAPTAFFANKKYYRLLRGLKLLKGVESIGLNLSMKAWLEGGDVRLATNVKAVCPELKDQDPIMSVYDKIVIVLTLIPKELLPDYINDLAELDLFEEAMCLVDVNSHLIDDFRINNALIFSEPFNMLDGINKIFRRLYGE